MRECVRQGFELISEAAMLFFSSFTGEGAPLLSSHSNAVVPGVLGPLFWNDLLWLAVPTNIICGLFLPITYVGVILWARRAERPSSATVLALMALATILLTTVLTATIVAKLA